MSISGRLLIFKMSEFCEKVEKILGILQRLKATQHVKGLAKEQWWF